MPAPDGFDPQAPLFGPDGLEYECFADFLIGRPADTWRNGQIGNLREGGFTEEEVRTWISAFDGPEACSCTKADANRQAKADSHLIRIASPRWAAIRAGVNI